MFSIRSQSRACAGCTMCCQGWLTGEAYGHRFQPGRPCGWLNDRGCMIYENRPYSPCQTFECEWKRRPSITQELKPSQSGVIMVARVLESWSYIRVVESRGAVPDSVLAWAQSYSAQYDTNIVVPVPGGVRVYTQHAEFRAEMAKTAQVVS